MHSLPLRILCVSYLQIGVHGLATPDEEVASGVNACLVVLSKLYLHEVAGQVGDELWREVLELQKRIRAGLVDSISPKIHLALRVFLLAEQSGRQRGDGDGSSPDYRFQKHANYNLSSLFIREGILRARRISRGALLVLFVEPADGVQALLVSPLL